MIAAVQGILLSLVIVFQQPRKQPSTYLGILLFLFSLSILHGVLEDSIHAFNGKFPIPMNFGMLYGPLALFHFRSLRDPSFRFNRKLLVHFIPSLLFDVLFFLILFSYAGSNMEWAYKHIVLIRLLALTVSFLVFIQIITYGWVIYREEKKHHADSPKKLGSWSRSFGIFWVVGVVLHLILLPIVYLSIEREDYGYNLFFVMGMFDSLFVYWFGYSYLFKYKTIITQILNRGERSKFSKEQLEKRKSKLLSAIVQDQLFKDQQLSVSRVAEKLDWPAKDVSSIISELLETNFNDLINKYRVEAFLAKVAEPESQRFSIDGIATEVGFNSKASFYRAFKKATGKTPSQYLTNLP